MVLAGGGYGKLGSWMSAGSHMTWPSSDITEWLSFLCMKKGLSCTLCERSGRSKIKLLISPPTPASTSTPKKARHSTSQAL